MDLLERRKKEFARTLHTAAEEGRVSRSFQGLADALKTRRGEIEKAGARHGKKDKALMKTAHDAMADMCDKACCMKAEKANRRHSAADMEKIQKVHDLLSELGHECPGLMGMDEDDE